MKCLDDYNLSSGIKRFLFKSNVYIVLINYNLMIIVFIKLFN